MEEVDGDKNAPEVYNVHIGIDTTQIYRRAKRSTGSSAGQCR